MVTPAPSSFGEVQVEEAEGQLELILVVGRQNGIDPANSIWL